MKKLIVNQLSELDSAGLAEIPVDRIEGRILFSRSRRIIDFCNTNYLGFDHEELPHRLGCEMASELGMLFGLSRLEANPSVYHDVEASLAKFLGVNETILSHTITITNFSIMSAIAKKGIIFADAKVHAVVFEAARLARDHGAKLEIFAHQDTTGLRKLLETNRSVGPKIICVDGIYSISSAPAPIQELHSLAEEFDAWLFVDDAHGFGVLGRNPTHAMPFGEDGAGLLAHRENFLGELNKRTFYVSSFGKAFCTHTAFVAPPTEYPEPIREQCLQYIFSAPMTPYVLGLVKGVMLLNLTHGRERRKKLHELTLRLKTGLQSLGCEILNENGFPIVFWKVGSIENLIMAAKYLLDAGVLGGLRAYPVVPKDQCGIRFGLTALHTELQVDRAIQAVSDFLQVHRNAT